MTGIQEYKKFIRRKLGGFNFFHQEVTVPYAAGQYDLVALNFTEALENRYMPDVTVDVLEGIENVLVVKRKFNRGIESRIAVAFLSYGSDLRIGVFVNEIQIIKRILMALGGLLLIFFGLIFILFGAGIIPIFLGFMLIFTHSELSLADREEELLLLRIIYQCIQIALDKANIDHSFHMTIPSAKKEIKSSYGSYYRR